MKTKRCMRIGIFGLGYVGAVSAACLVREGHQVVGVDAVEAKVRSLQSGNTPVQEPGVQNLLESGHKSGNLAASLDPCEGVRDADMVWICVGTPSSLDRGIDLTHVETVVAQIGRAMRATGSRPLVVMRSTVLPASMDEIVIPAIEKVSELKAGEDFNAVFHPEFLRESTAVADFDDPPKIVVGEQTPGAGDPLLELYKGFDAPVYRLSLREAEMVKYCDNLFHALKITFANEMGAIARESGVDARRVAEVFCSDTKLNISPKYLRPGFAFGGSCLPKDLRAILWYASLNSISVPMLNSVLESNKRQVEALVDRVCAHRPRKVGMVGLAFKPNTDDMRESPYVEVAKRLIGEGTRLLIFDPHVDPENLIGANKAMVESALGHLRSLMTSILADLDAADLILVNHPAVDAEQVQDWLDSGIRVIDLAGIKGVDCGHQNYEGIAW